MQFHKEREREREKGGGGGGGGIYRHVFYVLYP